MKQPIKILLLFVLLIAANVQTIAQTEGYTIDDFETGELNLLEVRSGNASRVQCGVTIIKRAGEARGYRQTTFLTVTPHSGSSHKVMASVKKGMCVVSSGYKMGHAFQLIYGVDKKNRNAPLNFNASTYKRINLEFEGSSKVINFNITATCCNGAHYAASPSRNLAASETPFTVSLPLSEFVSASKTFNWSDIDYLAFSFQTSSAIMGNDFAIKRIWLD